MMNSWMRERFETGEALYGALPLTRSKYTGVSMKAAGKADPFTGVNCNFKAIGFIGARETESELRLPSLSADRAAV